MRNELRISLDRFNWRLYAALLLTAVLPTIYTTIRINYLGDLPGDWGFNIASQLAWVNLMLEDVQEALILPQFYCIGITIANREETINRVRTWMTVTLGLYLVFTVVILLFATQLTVLPTLTESDRSISPRLQGEWHSESSGRSSND